MITYNFCFVFFSSRRRHTRCALVTGVQTCALPIFNSGPEASRLLRELAALIGAPVTSTLMGLGALPASSEQWLGMLGMHGTFEANMAMNKADLIVALGARFDDLVTVRLVALGRKTVL